MTPHGCAACGLRMPLPRRPAPYTCPVCCVLETGAYVDGYNERLAPEGAGAGPAVNPWAQSPRTPGVPAGVTFPVVLAARIARADAPLRPGLSEAARCAVAYATLRYEAAASATLHASRRTSERWWCARVATPGAVGFKGRPRRTDGLLEGPCLLEADSAAAAVGEWAESMRRLPPPGIASLAGLHTFVAVHFKSGLARVAVLSVAADGSYETRDEGGGGYESERVQRAIRAVRTTALMYASVFDGA